MGDAYTPGLIVTPHTVVRKTRRLPLPGTVQVARGDRVAAEDVVARTELPGRVHLLNLANRLGVLADELESVLQVEVGDAVAKDELLGTSKSFFGLFTNRLRSPITGTLESVSTVTGQAVLREPPVPVEVRAYIDGTIEEVMEGEGVVVESQAALVQGIFGLAGEVHAPLALAVVSPDAELEAGDFREEHRGKIVVGGSSVTLAGMRRAIELEVAAVIVGGFAYHDIAELLGYDIGVAVTGSEELGTTLVVTEGFGRIAMARATFELLQRFDGRPASVTGATQIRAGVIRPEVVLSLDEGESPGVADSAKERMGLSLGAPVRCIRAPHFGKLGTVAALPVELRKMESETLVRVLTVAFDGGGEAVVPRANVEVIER